MNNEVNNMGASVQSVRWLAWALVILAIGSAVLTLMLTFTILVPPPPPDIEDLVPRLEATRLADQQIFPFVVLQSLLTLGVFLVTAMLGAVLRAWARPTTLRDVMVLVFVIGGVLGITANVINIGVAQAASFGYCDCGFKTEELIAQDYAVRLVWTVVNWLSIAALTLTGVGVAIAGRLLDVSPAWRTLSFIIAAVIVGAAAIRVIAAFVFIQAFNPFQISDLLIAAAAGILVPIWAILLAGGIQGPEPDLAAPESY
ncbi:MAG: hypothetical protein ABIP77_08040 [Candidatus Limnocylindrales bacterium]